MVTSRALHSASSLQEVRISGQDIRQDISSYIDSHLARNNSKKWRKLLKGMIRETLVGGADVIKGIMHAHSILC